MKSAKCPSSITKKTDPLLLRHQGVKLVRHWPNTELKFPKGTSLHTESFITTLKKLLSHHAYQVWFVSCSLFQPHGICFQNNPFEVLSANHSIIELRDFRWLVSASVMLFKTYAVSSGTTVVLAFTTYYEEYKTPDKCREAVHKMTYEKT